ncbi:hypothetical protein PSN45_003616 [Yamadazyma tenuis]|nr:hypothetical protein PSN45_003616 [Yamadazyma tenuis]
MLVAKNIICTASHRCLYVLNTRQNSSSYASYERKLENYFKTGSFNLVNENAEKGLEDLRKAMQIVYPRKIPLIAFDVEAYERNLKKVTEIGIAIYDPVASEGSIFPIIKQTHLVIKEHQKLVNGRFCPDNKKSFMGGVSYLVSLKQSKNIITSVLQEYVNNRNAAFVGHHIEGDIKWFRSIGIEVSNNAPIVDSNKLYALSRKRGGTLRGVLRLLGIPHGYLHNAANDAYYTLLATMALCDPVIRTQKGLDVFVDNVKVPEGEARLQKFSDVAQMVVPVDENTIIDSLIEP